MKFLLSFLLLLTCNLTKAQYVNIPDTNFATFLRTNYPSAMSGSMLDTTHVSITSEIYLNCGGDSIKNLYGIQFFDNLGMLVCSENSLTTLPTLPSGLTALYCYQNSLTTLPALPSGLTFINCTQNSLTTLPALPSGLTELFCSQNSLTTLPSLPSGLIRLECDLNSLTTLPSLPSSLTILYCRQNSLTSLPALPSSLTGLYCEENALTTLPALPSSLTNLDCDQNALTTLPTLSTSHLISLSCYQNLLTTFPALPSTLRDLDCSQNLLTTLPASLSSLQVLTCNQNLLTSLPPLPTNLDNLFCSQNLLTSLPPLPSGLLSLDCSHNLLTTLPPLPLVLFMLDATDNPHLYCLPPFKNDTIGYFSVRRGTGISCLPKKVYIDNSIDSSDYLPLCSSTSGCPISYNIVGSLHQDTSVNCVLDSRHPGAIVNMVKVLKMKSSILDQQEYTDPYGYYSFDANIGDSISISIDTAELPLIVSCPITGSRSCNITATDSFFIGQDFGLKCKGIDIGVQSTSGAFRKNFIRTVAIGAGDMSKRVACHCADGVSGSVTIIISGMASYISPATGALTPTSISGSTLTYSVPDFGAIDFYKAFNIMVKTDSLATLGSNICIHTVVSTSSTDINHRNDTLTYCGIVVNSFDPNEKEAYPAQTTKPGDWITYTIRFQNTGTDTAYHIVVRDTLDAGLDVGSFTFLASSHPAQIRLDKNAMMFNFAHINLIDSLHNEPNSHGWLQYKVRTNAALPAGKAVTNRASIYFDDNDPVVTNTTINTFDPLSVKKFEQATLRMYPNPVEGLLNVEVTEEGRMGIYNMLGILVSETILHKGTNTISLPKMLSSGLYLYQFNADSGKRAQGKLQKQ